MPPPLRQMTRAAGTPFARGWRWVYVMARRVLGAVVEHGLTGYASQFAYNAFLATVPFVFVIVTAVRLAGSDAYESLFQALKNEIPGIDGLAGTFNNTVTSSGRSAGIIIVVGVLAGLYVASNALGALVHGLDRAEGLVSRPWVRGKLMNFGFAGGASVLAVASTLALAGGEPLVRGLARLLGASESVRELAQNIATPIGILSLLAFTVLLYRFGPNGMRLSWRSVLPGAFLSVLAWIGMTQLLRYYFDRFDSLNAVYGSLTAIFVYMTFLYFSGLMFLVGAEVNAELRRRRRRRRQPPPVPPLGEPLVEAVVGTSDD